MPPSTRNIGDVLNKAAKAVRDGYSASMASIVSVFMLMWLRTTLSYQFVHGVSMVEAMSLLYAQGGIPRFYRGLLPALIMMPLSRFGDIFSNEVTREFFSNRFSTGVVTALASSMAAIWRIIISPVDTVKTTMQVHGGKALPILQEKIRVMGFRALFEGSLGAAAATWVGHYPWFITYNFLESYCVRHRILDAHLPPPTSNNRGTRRHIRRAVVGLCSSLVSDCCSNAIRVLKTFKQTSIDPISYGQAAATIIAESGLRGLFLRGLTTKLFANALNAMLFTVVWKAISEKMAARKEFENQKIKNDKDHDHDHEEAVPLVEVALKDRSDNKSKGE